jgi:hypothetical protein
VVHERSATDHSSTGRENICAETRNIRRRTSWHTPCYLPGVPCVRRLAAAVVTTAALAAIAGCSSPSPDDETDGASAAVESSESALVYFHGMSGLGFSREMITKQASDDDVLAPRWSDSQLQAAPPRSVLDFLATHERATVSGYSLGRIPVLRLMKADAPGITRVVMVDPTFDGSGDLGRKAGGPITREWLDRDETRSFILVYGDATRSLGGESSYVTALAAHPRAELCFIPGDHERFRRADMVAAIVAKDCADVVSRLSGSR